jgi:hypothetical protein
MTQKFFTLNLLKNIAGENGAKLKLFTFSSCVEEELRRGVTPPVAIQ